MGGGKWLTAGILAAVALCVVLAGISAGLKKERSALIQRKKEILSLSNEFGPLKSLVDSAESKKSLSRNDGVVQAVDEIFKSIGLGRKLKSVKPLGVRDQRYATEEQAELQVEKVDMNEMVNIFYKLENAPLILPIKRSTIRPSFENPNLLNLTVTLSLVKPK